MPGIKDDIVVRFPVLKGAEINKILSEFKDVVEKVIKSGEDELVLERIIILNRPDSRDEGVTTIYNERVDELWSKLTQVDGASTHLHFTPFNLPAYLDP